MWQEEVLQLKCNLLYTGQLSEKERCVYIVWPAFQDLISRKRMNQIITKQHYKYLHRQPEAVYIACIFSLDRETVWERLHVGEGKMFM